MTAQEQVLTVEDANRRLPLVRAIVRDLVELSGDVRTRQDRLSEIRERYPSDEDAPYSDEVAQMEDHLELDVDRLDAFAAELRQVGAELVDAATGLVEFPSLLDGQAIRLSWMPDEPRIQFWRLEEDDSEDRRPLPEVVCVDPADAV
ncbi:MAG: DUF2203 family protein [Planctomycetaceae bacterium]|nr:DUF2203 family protein [Planctomycetaceae bacterium]